MVVRIALATGLAVALMAMVANGTMLRKVGLTSSCTLGTPTSTGIRLESCRAGWLNGYPSLSSQGCTSVTRVGRDELWSCPTR